MHNLKPRFLILLLLFAPLGELCAAEMTEDVMKAYYAAWTSGDVDTIMSHFSDDVVYADIPTGKRASGREAVRAFVQNFVDNYAGVKLSTASITIDDSSAAVEWIMSGGSGDEAWSVPGMCAFQLKNGLITSATDYWHKQ